MMLLGIIEGEPLLGVSVSLPRLAKMEQRKPQAMMRLENERRIASIFGQIEKLLSQFVRPREVRPRKMECQQAVQRREDFGRLT